MDYNITITVKGVVKTFITQIGGQMNEPTAIIFIVLGILGLIMAAGILTFYILVKKKQEAKSRSELKVTPKKSRMEIYKFWINYVYIFLIVVGILAGIILLPIGIGGFV